MRASRSSSASEQTGVFTCDIESGGTDDAGRLCRFHPELVKWTTDADGRRFGYIDDGVERSLKAAGENLEKADRYLAAH
jgi:hypothetical protein